MLCIIYNVYTVDNIIYIIYFIIYICYCSHAVPSVYVTVFYTADRVQISCFLPWKISAWTLEVQQSHKQPKPGFWKWSGKRSGCNCPCVTAEKRAGNRTAVWYACVSKCFINVHDSWNTFQRKTHRGYDGLHALVIIMPVGTIYGVWRIMCHRLCRINTLRHIFSSKSAKGKPNHSKFKPNANQCFPTG